MSPSLLLLAALLLQGAAPAPAPPSAPPTPAPAGGDRAGTAGAPEEGPAPPAAEPRELLREVLALAADGRTEEAFARADAYLAAGPPGPMRDEEALARLHFARGVLGAGLPEPRPAAETSASFDSARALAGPGDLRLFATYDAGTVHLLEGERHRAEIPELGGGGGAGGAPPGLPVPGATPPGEDAPDPLELARASYLAAREGLVERLRLDPRDADPRANLELCLRRLRELDEVQKKREEQQQQEQQQQDSSGQQGDQDQDAQKQPSDEQQQPSEDQKTQDGEQGDQQKDQEEKRPPEGQGEQQRGEPEDAQGREGEQDQKKPADSQPAERILTREEAMQLLDRLGELEKEARELEALLREARRVPVKRDW